MFDVVISQYMCMCQKNYKIIGYFKCYLEREYNWYFFIVVREEFKKGDKVVVWWLLFMKVVFILRDIFDVYKMGDGNWIFLNVKFEMLCVNVVGYIKYQFWLWRMMVYEQVILIFK